MALSNPRSLFGIHSVAMYNTTTRVPYGIVKVAKGANLALTGETVELTGGSFRYPWAIEDGLISTELSLTFAEYPNFLYEVLLGKSVTENTSDTTGDISAITNQNGTSVVDATTGIASVGLLSGDSADLKFGKYLVKVTDSSTDTITVYNYTDIDFARGTDTSYTDDTLAIGTAIIPGSGGTVSLADYGLEFTGGSGTIALTDDDTAYFEVRPVNTKNITVTIGGANDVFPEFGCLIYAQKKGGGQMYEIDLFKCKGIGLPLNFTPQEFSEAEVTIKAFYDSARSGIMSIRSIDSFS